MSESPRRYVCIHGHFYQPPRENPWLEAIEVQDSAAPFHDWNERVAAECYGPNAVARLLDEDGYVTALRNNYADISFNFGPTLLSWMERARPDVYAAIIEADRVSQGRIGHGNAIAQVYGHCILPLASPQDKLTQVRWGIADFVHRFGRQPEGMWLPETAVDLASLRVLADHGIRFTILAPRQAARVRYAGGPWHPVTDGAIDSTQPYLCDLGDGRSIVLFFYDGGLAQAIAFGGLLNDGHEFARRITAIARERHDTALIHVATDGESYGHHHRFGEMALSSAIEQLRNEGDVRLTNYAAYLEVASVVDAVEIHENSSWSCVHGLERWRSHCGCNAGGGGGAWQQHWRAPLRDTLDWLKEQIDALFVREGEIYFKDVWAARDAYVQVILQNTPERRDAFLSEHVRRTPRPEERPRLWKLVEMERQAMLSFTSCGWFFDEPSGLETTQVLTYAARALQLADHLGADLETGFLRRLAPMRSNLPQFTDGIDIYNHNVRPLVSDSRRIVAQYAMRSLFKEPATDTRSYVYRILSQNRLTERSGDLRFVAGQAHFTDGMTELEGEYEYAALHFGGHDVQCAVRTAPVGDNRAHHAKLLEVFRTAPLGELVRQLDAQFPGGIFTLQDVFTDERRQIVDSVTAHARLEATAAYEQIVDDNRRLIEFLALGGGPILPELKVAAGFVLQCHFDRQILQLIENVERLSVVKSTLDEAIRWGIELDFGVAARRLEQALATAVGELPDSAEGLRRAHDLLDAAAGLSIDLNVAEAQNRYYAMWLLLPDRRSALTVEILRLADRLRFRLPKNGPNGAVAA